MLTDKLKFLDLLPFSQPLQVLLHESCVKLTWIPKSIIDCLDHNPNYLEVNDSLKTTLGQTIFVSPNRCVIYMSMVGIQYSPSRNRISRRIDQVHGRQLHCDQSSEERGREVGEQLTMVGGELEGFF